MLEIVESWTPTQAEFDRFAKLSGDDNPIHVDPGFAARSKFGRTVSHGMLIYAKLWALLRKHCPEARDLTQEIMFPNPAFAGETLVLTLSEIEPGQIKLAAHRRADKAPVFLGKARVKR